jgi:hypothetical protein
MTTDTVHSGEAAIAVDDIVKIDGTDPAFAGCLLEVTAIDGEDALGTITVPRRGGAFQVKYRIALERVTKVGRSVVL